MMWQIILTIALLAASGFLFYAARKLRNSKQSFAAAALEDF